MSSNAKNYVSTYQHVYPNTNISMIGTIKIVISTDFFLPKISYVSENVDKRCQTTLNLCNLLFLVVLLFVCVISFYFHSIEGFQW